MSKINRSDMTAVKVWKSILYILSNKLMENMNTIAAVLGLNF